MLIELMCFFFTYLFLFFLQRSHLRLAALDRTVLVYQTNTWLLKQILCRNIDNTHARKNKFKIQVGKELPSKTHKHVHP